MVGETEALSEEEMFDHTIGLLEELARERDIPVEELYRTERIDRTYWGDDYEGIGPDEAVSQVVEQEDLARTYAVYEWMTDLFQREIHERMEEMEEENDSIPLIRAVDDLLIEIGWYLDLLYGKLRRALYGWHFTQLEVIKNEEDDYNGTAKLCLVSLRVSREKWMEISRLLPDFSTEIDQVLVVVDQLEHDVNDHFPEAREFYRPGLDNPDNL